MSTRPSTHSRRRPGPVRWPPAPRSSTTCSAGRRPPRPTCCGGCSSASCARARSSRSWPTPWPRRRASRSPWCDGPRCWPATCRRLPPPRSHGGGAAGARGRRPHGGHGRPADAGRHRGHGGRGARAHAGHRLGGASVEWKLDGARIQAHRDGDEVRLFTRNLNEVTEPAAGHRGARPVVPGRRSSCSTARPSAGPRTAARPAVPGHDVAPSAAAAATPAHRSPPGSSTCSTSTATTCSTGRSRERLAVLDARRRRRRHPPPGHRRRRRGRQPSPTTRSPAATRA